MPAIVEAKTAGNSLHRPRSGRQRESERCRIDYDLPVEKAFEQAADTVIGPVLRSEQVAQAAGLAPAAVDCVASVESTNLSLMSAPLHGSPLDPRVLIASQQTAGRGRRGRTWLSCEPDCLTMSIALHRLRSQRAPLLTGLSLALAVAIARKLSQRVEGIGLKWPNDLLRHGRKFAGMLVETRLVDGYERVVIGLGLNWRLPAEVADALGGVATGLFDRLPEQAEREQLTGELVGALVDAGLHFFAVGFEDTAARWAPFDVLHQRPVVVLGPGLLEQKGIADGLGTAGLMRLRTDDGIRLISAGEVSVREPDAPGRPFAGQLA